MVNLTPVAVENVKRMLAENDLDSVGLRFGLRGGGCSGYKYVLEFEDAPTDADDVFEFDGVKVFVAKEHQDLLKNSTIDWTDTLLESGFQIENPQAKRPCGCGQSVDF
jgi:iron-sulfur cluster assembly protein